MRWLNESRFSRISKCSRNMAFYKGRFTSIALNAESALAHLVGGNFSYVNPAVPSTRSMADFGSRLTDEELTYWDTTERNGERDRSRQAR
jgi:hypothetical protein